MKFLQFMGLDVVINLNHVIRVERERENLVTFHCSDDKYYSLKYDTEEEAKCAFDDFMDIIEKYLLEEPMYSPKHCPAIEE